MKLFATLVAPLVVPLLVLLAPQVHGSTLTLGFDTEFSGAQEPGGTAPWIVATFDDAGLPGSVRLTIAASGLVSDENISKIFFNLDQGLDPTDLDFTFLPALSTGPDARRVRTGTDAYKAAGGGEFDIVFEFRNGKGFDAGEVVAFDIAGITGLTPASFNVLSTPKGSHEGILSAAHVQNTTGADAGDSDDDDGDDSGDSGSSGSGWIKPTLGTYQEFPPGEVPAVPVPAAVWLFGSGLVALVGFARRRRAA